MVSTGLRPSYEDLVAGGFVLVGSPDSVVARIRELHEELGFGQLIGLFSIGDITHDETVRSMELFAGQVIPAVRPLGVLDPALR